jgi:pimeloyl-ACP methyl ester carboxylesterase
VRVAPVLDTRSPGGAVVAADSDERVGEVIVLVHGLGRTRLSMLPLEWSMERAGYEVLNWGYSSTCCSVDEIARQLVDDLDEELRERPELAGARFHFVGHSLGNIVVRSMLAAGPPVSVGRVVMLAPPNRGSLVADRYERYLAWLLRPLPELTTRDGSTARALPLPPAVEVGVIAGRYDGKVSVADSHLSGQADHVVVPSAHTFIMAREDVRRLVLSFLRTGSFS